MGGRGGSGTKRAAGASGASGAARGAASREDAVRAAYADVAKDMKWGIGSSVGLEQIREGLAARGITSRADQDSVLTSMYRSQQVNLASQANQQALRVNPERQAAALRVAGAAKHLMIISPNKMGS